MTVHSPERAGEKPWEPPPGHISVSRLIRMGLTPRTIWRVLGPPHLSATPIPFPKDRENHHYRLEAVEDASRSREFQAARLVDILHRARAIRLGEERLKKALRWARTVPITHSFPEEDQDGVIRAAAEERDAWDDLQSRRRRTETADRATLETWAYTRLKHLHTGYDGICRELEGMPFGHYAYTVVLHRVNLMILDRYPLRNIRVRGDTGGRTRTCHRCGVTAPGEWNGHYWVKPGSWRSSSGTNGSRSVRDYCSFRCASGPP